MLRRLLHDLQQGVEGGLGEHVHFVDDIHPPPGGHRRIDRLVPDGANVVHAVVGGGVHLRHVQDGAGFDAPADLALTAGAAPHRIQAVHRLGQELGAGGLACAPGAGEQIGMAGPIRQHLFFQDLRDMLLAHYLVKGLGPPFSV